MIRSVIASTRRIDQRKSCDDNDIAAHRQLLTSCPIMEHEPLPYAYDPGEHRPKHRGATAQASFRQDGTALVGQCPCDLTQAEAQTLLAQGVPDPVLDESGHPQRIYAVHHGVVYEAQPTRPGYSYHDYPWRGRPGHNRLPRPVKRELKARAERSGHLREFNDWLKTYES